MTSILNTHLIFSNVLCSILLTSNAIGIYQGQTTQLFPKNYYLEFIDYLREDVALPPLWLYIGLRRERDGASFYTYGLKTSTN